SGTHAPRPRPRSRRRSGPRARLGQRRPRPSGWPAEWGPCLDGTPSAADRAVRVEGRAHDFGGDRPVPDHDFDAGPGPCRLDREVGEADPLVEGRRDGPARDLAGRFAFVADFVAVAGEATLEEPEPGEPLPHALGLLSFQGGAAEEIAFVELDDPAKSGLERRARVVEVVAVEAVPHLEAERVTCAEPGRDEAIVVADLEDPPPERDRVLVRDVEFEAILAGVPGPADHRVAAVDLALDEVVVADLLERRPGQPLQDRLRHRPLDREDRALVGPVDDHRVAGRRELPGPVEDLLAIHRVHDEEIAVLEAVDQAVVEDRAV